MLTNHQQQFILSRTSATVALAIRVAKDKSRSIWALSRREYAPGGFISSPMPPSATLRDILADGIYEVAVIILPNTLVDEWLSDLDQECICRLPVVLFAENEQGELLHDDVSCKDWRAPIVNGVSCALHITGESPVAFHKAPAAFEVTLSPARDSNFFCVRADSPGWPEQQWFHAEGVNRGRIVIQAQPASPRDVWSATSETDGLLVRPVEAPGRSHLEKISLIIDRTCPDANRWSSARSRLLSSYSSNAYGVVGSAAENQEPFPAFNSDIRRGIVEGFGKINNPRLQVDVFWFADVADKTVSAPEGADMPRRAVGGYEAALPANGIAPAVEQCGYSFGLDLWDPLEEALAMTADHVERNAPGSPVLIVGNSPPHVPSRPESSFWTILNDSERRSTTRVRSPLFERSLQRLENANCRVMYLFAIGHECESEGQFEFEEFQVIQRQIRLCLEDYMDVVTCTARASGVAEGVLQSVEKLSANVSRLKVSPVGDNQ